MEFFVGIGANASQTDISEKPHWSLETGYETSESTPLPTPIKKSFERFQIGDFKQVVCTSHAISVSTPSGIPDSELRGRWPSANGLRPITKKIELMPTRDDEKAICKLAEQLADLRLALGAEAGWSVEDLSLVEQYPCVPMAEPQPFGQWKNMSFSNSVPRRGSGSLRSQRKFKPICEFCRNNGTNGWEFHRCKNSKGETVCPVLQQMTCPICGATGTSAHTKRHCPLAELNRRLQLERALKIRE